MAATVDPRAHPLQDTLHKTDAVAADIESAALQAQVIATVLTQELPDEIQVDEVAQAIEQTDQLHQKLADSAETLADVSAALDQEIKKRRAVTEELVESREMVDKLSAEAAAPEKRSP